MIKDHFNKYIDLTTSRLEKTKINSLFLSSMILCCELFFFIFGLINFDLTERKRILSMSCYLFLIVVSIVAILIIMLFRKNQKKYQKTVFIINNIYFFAIISWSTMISIIDLGYGSRSVAMVYMTVLMATGVIMTIHPIFYSTSSILTFVALLIFSNRIRSVEGIEALNFGFYSNMLIYLIFAILINRSVYSLQIKDHNSSIELYESSIKDGLTGLFNRRFFESRLDETIKMKKDFVLIVSDIDNFKDINDMFGHICGDEGLRILSNVLKTFFGNDVFRLGGDEFAVITNKSLNEVIGFLSNINELLDKETSEFALRISSGIYCYDQNDTQLEMYKKADKALYQAKHKGKVTYCICE